MVVAPVDVLVAGCHDSRACDYYHREEFGTETPIVTQFEGAVGRHWVKPFQVFAFLLSLFLPLLGISHLQVRLLVLIDIFLRLINLVVFRLAIDLPQLTQNLFDEPNVFVRSLVALLL